jgi:hypothetical protein
MNQISSLAEVLKAAWMYLIINGLSHKRPVSEGAKL